MRRSRTLQLTIALALFTAIAPLVLAIYIARQQGINLEFERVMSYVDDLLYRSDRTVAQMEDALAQLNVRSTSCSDVLIQQMQQIDLQLDFVEVIGHVTGTRMDCSSLGWHSEPIELGGIDLTAQDGMMIRLTMNLPIESSPTLIGLQDRDFIAISYQNQAIYPIIERTGVQVATFTPINGVIRGTTGGIDHAWIENLGDDMERVFVDGDRIVGVAISKQVALTGAVAAISTDVLDQRILTFIALLLPIGIITGAGLTALVIHLARQRMSVPNEIKRGLKNNEFFLAYQPIVSLETEQNIGAEALIRWRKPDGSIAYPDAFIGIAESSGLIGAVTERVIALAEKDLPVLAGSQLDFCLSINLSASDLLSENILQLLKTASKSQTGKLSVELTERTLLDPTAGRASIQILRNAGISISLDDFGTGYSSLSYLETMKFDCLKIDRLFVEAIDTGAATNGVVLHIIEMAKTLNLSMVAEGVETREQADYLRERGVERAQGWLFGRPVELKEFGKPTTSIG